MSKRKTFLSYVKISTEGLERVLYRTRITGERSTVKHEKNKGTTVSDFLDYHFDLIENKNTLYPYLVLTDDDKQEIEDILTNRFTSPDPKKKNAVKFVIGIELIGSSYYTYLHMKFTSNGVTQEKFYRTKNPDPYGTLLSKHCGIGYELIGVFADGEYGTYEEVLDWYSTECGYDPEVPVPFILDGGCASTVFECGNAGGGGATLPPGG